MFANEILIKLCVFSMQTVMKHDSYNNRYISLVHNIVNVRY